MPRCQTVSKTNKSWGINNVLSGVEFGYHGFVVEHVLRFPPPVLRAADPRLAARVKAGAEAISTVLTATVYCTVKRASIPTQMGFGVECMPVVLAPSLATYNSGTGRDRRQMHKPRYCEAVMIFLSIVVANNANAVSDLVKYAPHDLP